MRSLSCILFANALLLALTAIAPAWAQDPPATDADAVEAAETTTPQLEVETQDEEGAPEATTAPEAPDPDPEADEPEFHNSEIVRVGENAHLPAGHTADTIVTIFGSSTSEGEARDGIVAVFGDTRITGNVGDSVAAVFGDAYIDSRVGGDVAAVFGDLELGPNAEIGGEAVVFAGTLTRHPDAVVHGGVQELSFAGEFGQFRWIRPWIQHCLLLGRPLALDANLDWAWWLAFGFLGFYVLISLLFSDAVEKCVRTLEERPGETAIASIVTIFLSPLFMFLLAITVLGAVFVPFFLLALFAAGLFGKAVVLAALGRRVTRFAEPGPLTHVALATLIGGLVVTALYLVPVFGFILFMLIAILGLGSVSYTLLLAARARSPRVAAARAGTGGDTPLGATMSATPPGYDANSSAAPDASTSTAAPAGAGSVPPVPLIALPRADFWVRMGALAIDAVLIAIIASLIPGEGDVWLPLLAIYGAVMWKLKGTTVGGIICNLRLVRLDGREVDWATAIVRVLGCFLSLAVVGLGFIWIAIDPERQAWHDKIAGTLVVRTPRGTALV